MVTDYNLHTIRVSKETAAEWKAQFEKGETWEHFLVRCVNKANEKEKHQSQSMRSETGNAHIVTGEQ